MSVRHIYTSIYALLQKGKINTPSLEFVSQANHKVSAQSRICTFTCMCIILSLICLVEQVVYSKIKSHVFFHIIVQIQVSNHKSFISESFCRTTIINQFAQISIKLSIVVVQFNSILVRRYKWRCQTEDYDIDKWGTVDY